MNRRDERTNVQTHACRVRLSFSLIGFSCFGWSSHGGAHRDSCNLVVIVKLGETIDVAGCSQTDSVVFFEDGEDLFHGLFDDGFEAGLNDVNFLSALQLDFVIRQDISHIQAGLAIDEVEQLVVARWGRQRNG